MTDAPGTARLRPLLQNPAALMAARVGARLAAGEVADRAGVSLSLIYQAERGACGLSPSTLRRIAGTLGCPVTGLLSTALLRRIGALMTGADGDDAAAAVSSYREAISGDAARDRYDEAVTEAAQLLAVREDADPVTAEAVTHFLAGFSPQPSAA